MLRQVLTDADAGSDQAFPPMRHAPSSGPSQFSQTVSSSPSLYQSRPAPLPLHRARTDGAATNSTDSPYSSGFPRINSSYGSTPGSDYSMASSQTIPSISGLTQGSLSSPPLGQNPNMMGQFNQSIPRYVHRTIQSRRVLTTCRSQGLYDSSMYGQSMTSAPPGGQLYASSRSPSYPSPMSGAGANDMMPKPAGGSEAAMRVLNQRPKPQCWEHGCNGRQFSTFSNLLRHQREKSGTASKSYCPRCNAEFTRTTARNGHLAHDKCTKTRRDSEEQ